VVVGDDEYLFHYAIPSRPLMRSSWLRPLAEETFYTTDEGPVLFHE
jgi:hypothetical protein